MAEQMMQEAAGKAIPAGYKQTEVGVIPEDWGVFEIQDLIYDLRGGAPFKPSDFTKQGVKVLPKGGVVRGGILKIKEIEQQYCDVGFASKYVKNSVDEKYTIVVLRDLVPSGPSIGLMVRISHPDNYVLAQGVYGFLSKSKALSDYLIQYSNTSVYRRAANEIMVGSTQVHITNGAFKSIKIGLPNCENEQTAIANVLSDSDALIDALEQLIAKKQAIKSATMQQLLTGRTRLPAFALRPDGTPKGYKPSELGEIPEDWEVVRLGSIANFLKGSGLSKSEISESGAYKCIHYGQLFTTYGEKIEHVISRTKFKGVVLSEVNDVLMPTSDVTPNGLATGSCIMESGVSLGGDILIIRATDKGFDGVFFAYLIDEIRVDIMKMVTGSTVYHLYGHDMANLKLILPTLEEQTAIATILSDMDNELQALTQKLEKVRALKQGMMQQLLTGKIRLPLAAGA